jgi:SAM-dependent methyltransferase
MTPHRITAPLRRRCPGLFRWLKGGIRRLVERFRVHSPGLSRFLQSGVHLVTGRTFKEDYLDRWRSRRDALTPPLRLLFDGTRSYREFQELGDGFRDFLIGLGLRPEHHVLEVGSGNGKNARALAPYLAAGRYEGFDIVRAGIAWCQKHITPRYPHVRFHHADVYNRTYNPAGQTPASAYRFPYPDGTFDLVVLTSVFTHMLPADLENYVREIARVLKPGGRCLASFFLLTDESRQGMPGERGRVFPFAHASGICRVADRDWPEDAIAYEDVFIRSLFARHGLPFVEQIVQGEWWHGEPNGQDIIRASREH